MSNAFMERWMDLTMTIFYLILPAVSVLTFLALVVLVLWPWWKRWLDGQ